MVNYSNEVVLDISVLESAADGFVYVFSDGVEIQAVSYLSNDQVVRLLLSHGDLRRLPGWAPISLRRAKLRYPFLFFETAGANPILYREF